MLISVKQYECKSELYNVNVVVEKILWNVDVN